MVLSDGEDTTSLVSFEEVMELAKRSETTIYTIGLQPRDATFQKGFREAEFVLRQFAQETGGRAFFVQKAEEQRRLRLAVAEPPAPGGFRGRGRQAARAHLQGDVSDLVLDKPKCSLRE